MTLAASGQIGIGGTSPRSINLELGLSATAQADINTSTYRTLAGKASGQIAWSDFYGKSNFSGVTHTYNSGSGNETVPTGAVSLTLTMWGGGGGGGCGGTGAGGGGGGYVQLIRSVLSSEWGTTLPYSVGAGGAPHSTASSGSGTAGGNSTVTGTLNGSAVNCTAGGGGAGGTGTTGTSGTGGTASGGTTNTAGHAGYNVIDDFPTHIAGDGGDAGGAGGGAGGLGSAASWDGSAWGDDQVATVATAPGGGGGGAFRAGTHGGYTLVGTSGADGRITFTWS